MDRLMLDMVDLHLDLMHALIYLLFPNRLIHPTLAMYGEPSTIAGHPRQAAAERDSNLH